MTILSERSDGTLDFRDLDSDDDGIADAIEAHDADRDGKSDVEPGVDANGDGKQDADHTLEPGVAGRVVTLVGGGALLAEVPPALPRLGALPVRVTVVLQPATSSAIALAMTLAIGGGYKGTIYRMSVEDLTVSGRAAADRPRGPGCTRERARYWTPSRGHAPRTRRPLSEVVSFR